MALPFQIDQNNRVGNQPGSFLGLLVSDHPHDILVVFGYQGELSNLIFSELIHKVVGPFKLLQIIPNSSFTDENGIPYWVSNGSTSLATSTNNDDKLTGNSSTDGITGRESSLNNLGNILTIANK